MDKHSRTRLAGKADRRRKPRREEQTETGEDVEDELSEEPAPAEAAVEEEEPGVACIRCGSADTYVWRTIQRPSYTERQRCCRKCGKRFPTHEKPA